MYAMYGNYVHAANEVSSRIFRQASRAQGGQPTGYVVRIMLRGYMQAETVAALTTALSAMESAYSQQGRDWGMYNDDNSPTVHVFRSNQTFGGVRVMSGPSYPTSEGAEYCTYRTYEIELEAEYKTSNVTFDSWQETLSFEGYGGPIYRYIPTLNGPWQKQMVSQRSTYRARQSGSITSQFGPPNYPAPIWPNQEHAEQRRISPVGPVYDGTRFSNFAVSWDYVFESNEPLVGNPNTQPG